MWRFYLAALLLLSGCVDQKTESAETSGPTLFKKLNGDSTGIKFQNTLSPSEDFDVFRYRNYYNGGGVGIADFNNDGLADVYLTSNMGDNKLFLNKGSWKFEDITEKAGVKGSRIWSTGVSIADVNGDGLLDLYISNAGDVNGDHRENELFINNGDLTFTDKASEFGLADNGFSTHAAFFDFDKDGDLDCFVLNNSHRPVASLGYENLRDVRDELGGHKLYRNDNGHFTDISERAGIYGSVIGFGLGVTVGDVNQDNWLDMYVANDFYERDYLYINDKKGGFTESLENYMGHISMFSMGADLADLNNDGYPEIFSTDMLPEDDYRLKTLSSFETYDVYQLRLRNGYYHQFMRNMLQLNNGDNTFSEIGQMAGVEATDWSWGALIADFDNNLYKEIFVCNGIYKDVTNQDFVEFLGSSEQMHAAIDGKKVDFRKLVDRMPSVKLSNYMFTKDTGSWRFKNVSAEWGLNEPSFSNGAAYGDLDNDGDLDMVINNVNQELFVYQNQSREKTANHYFAIQFKGAGKNPFAIGTNVKAYVGGEIVTAEHMPIRGFQSSMDYKMVLGMGSKNVIDSLLITWPDSKIQLMKNVAVDQVLTAEYSNAIVAPAVPDRNVKGLLKEVAGGNVRHIENQYNDFDRDRLCYHMLSTQGPAFAAADLNSDGFDDFYLGGSPGNSGNVFMQRDGKFLATQNGTTASDTNADETDAVFFDADNDNDLDLYVVTGGAENTTKSLQLRDNYYENVGTRSSPKFLKGEKNIPTLYESGSCVRPADVDNDGDLDLFVGSRSLPGYYGLPADQFLLINDGKGNFSDATAGQAQQLRALGMVTDAAWFNYDGDAFPDLIIVGDWMPVTIFSNNGKQFTKVTDDKGLENTEGLWNRIQAADLDGDGDTDFILGNLGLNSKLKASKEKPLWLEVNDFDQNGSIEPVFAFEKDGKKVPLALRTDMVKQMSSLKKKIIYYEQYGKKTLEDLFDPKLLEKATELQIREVRSSVLMNLGNRSFSLKPLPEEAQISPVFGISVEDIDGNGTSDLILGGNLFAVKPEIGRYDALHGLVLLGNGKGDFKPLSSRQSGLSINGEVRHINVLSKGKGQSKIIAIVRNNEDVKFYSIQK